MPAPGPGPEAHTLPVDVTQLGGGPETPTPVLAAFLLQKRNSGAGLLITAGCAVSPAPGPQARHPTNSPCFDCTGRPPTLVQPSSIAPPPARQVLFYCHFPDLLLAQRQSALRRAYRAPIDALEQATTGRADKVLVNSKFTQGGSGVGGAGLWGGGRAVETAAGRLWCLLAVGCCRRQGERDLLSVFGRLRLCCREFRAPHGKMPYPPWHPTALVIGKK